MQVHPTGLVEPSDPDAKVKWLAAEALRGCGGIILDNEGKRFCDEVCSQWRSENAEAIDLVITSLIMIDLSSFYMAGYRRSWASVTT